jgi:hypothetical protein
VRGAVSEIVLDKFLGYEVMSGFKSTPDTLLHQPVLLQRRQCRWIEYKNSFEAGVVVYKLAFEENLLDIEGVDYGREIDFFVWLQK